MFNSIDLLGYICGFYYVRVLDFYYVFVNFN